LLKQEPNPTYFGLSPLPPHFKAWFGFFLGPILNFALMGLGSIYLSLEALPSTPPSPATTGSYFAFVLLVSRLVF